MTRRLDINQWLARLRRFWSAYVDALERHLDRIDRSALKKEKTGETDD